MSAEYNKGCIQECRLLASDFPGPLLLIVLVIRYRNLGQNIRYHFALLNAAQVTAVISLAPRGHLKLQI